MPFSVCSFSGVSMLHPLNYLYVNYGRIIGLNKYRHVQEYPLLGLALPPARREQYRVLKLTQASIETIYHGF